MTLNEFIEQLQAIAEQDESFGNATVVAAIQPQYPLAVEVDQITGDFTGDAPVIWIATGSHPHGMNPYAPSHAWDGDIVYALHSDDN